MICPNCGKDNNYYHRYCYECGNQLQTGENIEDLSQPEAIDTPAPIVFGEDDTETGFFSRNKLLKLAPYAAIIVIGAFGLSLIGFNLFKNRPGGNLVNPSATVRTSTPLLTSAPPRTPTPTPEPTPTATPVPITLDLVQPVGGTDSTEKDQYTLSFNTNGNTIFVNDEQQDIAPDGSGNVSLNLSLTQYGENKFVVRAIDEYNQERELTVLIDKLYPLTTLSLAEKQVLSTNKAKIVVSGTTMVGAQVAVKSDLTYKEPIKVDTKGKFSIEFALPVLPGQYEVNITALAKDHREAILPCVVEKLIDEKTYQKAAIACKYDTLVNNPNAYIGKVVFFSGTIDTLDPADKKKFTFRMDKKTSQLVYIEYTGSTAMVKGAARKLYGEYVGTVDGMPHLLVRMAYKLATPTEDPWEPAN